MLTKQDWNSGFQICDRELYFMYVELNSNFIQFKCKLDGKLIFCDFLLFSDCCRIVAEFLELHTIQRTHGQNDQKSSI